MKLFSKTARLELAVIGFCAWQGMEVLMAWRSSPFDRLGWLALLVWLVPVVVAVARQPVPATDSILFVCAGLAVTVAGRLLDVNALLGFGIALSLTALVPGSWRRTAWLAGSVCWMPLLGWLAHNYPPALVVTGRLMLAVAAAGAMMVPVRRAGIA